MAILKTLNIGVLLIMTLLIVDFIFKLLYLQQYLNNKHAVSHSLMLCVKTLFVMSL
jgi:hypothetical protein